MPVTVKHITLWRTEVENKPGVLARTLESLAAASADLYVVMGYRYPGGGEKAAIEVYPVTSKKSVAAAQAAGFIASSIPTLLVEGDNKPGLAHAVAKAIGDAGPIRNVLACVSDRHASRKHGHRTTRASHAVGPRPSQEESISVVAPSNRDFIDGLGARRCFLGQRISRSCMAIT
jgi:hypothetical protein